MEKVGSLIPGPYAWAIASDATAPACVVGTAGSVQDTLAHLVNVEVRYVAMLRETPHPPPDYFRFPGFAELRQRAEASGEALITFVDGQNLDRVARGVYQGRPYTLPVAIPLVQAINHATEHRAHENVILTQWGVQPLVLDAWSYSRRAADRRVAWRCGAKSGGGGPTEVSL